jgi:glucose/arabinose dehydrogenase
LLPIPDALHQSISANRNVVFEWVRYNNVAPTALPDRPVKVLCAILLAQIPQESDLPGHRTYIDPTRLPKPYYVKSKISIPKIIRGQSAPLRGPAGFKISVFATGLQSPRNLCVAPNGDVFVVESYQGKVKLLRDTDGDKSADKTFLFADRFKLPYGIQIFKDWLYVANTNSVVRFPYQPGQTKGEKGQLVLDGLPSLGYNQHWTRNIVFSPDKQTMFVTVGSGTNKKVEPSPRGTIQAYDPGGKFLATYATGLRNPVGLAFRPGTDELWATCIERDFMGHDLVPDFITEVRAGEFYGWPWWYIGKNRDSKVPLAGAPKKLVTIPDVLTIAHSVPLNLCFYRGSMFPAEYRGNAFVAMRGSTNRPLRSGYKIVRITFRNGRLDPGYEDFIVGWVPDRTKREVFGRPVAVAEWTDGSLLIADESAHCIYRVSYSK